MFLFLLLCVAAVAGFDAAAIDVRAVVVAVVADVAFDLLPPLLRTLW